jgi:hypothetical protein
VIAVVIDLPLWLYLLTLAAVFLVGTVYGRHG